MQFEAKRFSFMCLILLAGCSGLSSLEDHGAGPARTWVDAIRQLEVEPIYPPTSGVRPGDVFLDSEHLVLSDYLGSYPNTPVQKYIYLGNIFEASGASRDHNTVTEDVLFPSFSFDFSVTASGELGAFPLGAISLGASALGERGGSITVNVSDATSSLTPSIEAVDRMETWCLENQDRLAFLFGRPKYFGPSLLLVTRTYDCKGLEVLVRSKEKIDISTETVPSMASISVGRSDASSVWIRQRLDKPVTLGVQSIRYSLAVEKKLYGQRQIEIGFGLPGEKWLIGDFPRDHLELTVAWCDKIFRICIALEAEIRGHDVDLHAQVGEILKQLHPAASAEFQGALNYTTLPRACAIVCFDYGLVYRNLASIAARLSQLKDRGNQE